MHYQLKYPITDANGKSIAAVTIRRTTGGDLCEIGDEIATLARFYTSNANAISAMAEYSAALERGENPPEIDASQINPPGSGVYRAMVRIAGQIAGLGEDAKLLDSVDLQEIAARAVAVGESSGTGEKTSGAAQ